MARASRGLNRFFIFAAAFLFSTGGAAIKACSLTSWQVAGFRSGIAAAVLWLLMPSARRAWTWRTWAIGVTYAATLILFVLANRLTTSANAIFLQSTSPFYLLLLGPLVLREPLWKIDFAVACALAAGVLLLFSGAETVSATAPDPRLGNLIGLASGVTWAVTLTGLRWMGKRPETAGPQSDPGAATVIAGNAVAFLVCLPMALPVAHASVTDVSVVLYLGIFQIGLAYVFLTRSLREVPGFEAATLLLFEPVFNPVWSGLIHGERPSVPALCGGVSIIVAALAGTWWHGRFTAISQS